MKKNKKIKKKREEGKKRRMVEEKKGEKRTSGKETRKRTVGGGREGKRWKKDVRGAGWKKGGGGDSLNLEPRRANAFIIRRFNLSGSSRSVTVPGVN